MKRNLIFPSSQQHQGCKIVEMSSHPSTVYQCLQFNIALPLVQKYYQVLCLYLGCGSAFFMQRHRTAAVRGNIRITTSARTWPQGSITTSATLRHCISWWFLLISIYFVMITKSLKNLQLCDIARVAQCLLWQTKHLHFSLIFLVMKVS